MRRRAELMQSCHTVVHCRGHTRWCRALGDNGAGTVGDVRVAAIQMTSGADRTANLQRASALVHDAAVGGAGLVVLPEFFAALGPNAVLASSAESPIDGPTVSWARSTAAAAGVWLVAGSIVEQAGDCCHNTSVLVDPDGGLVAAYRKIHLFDSQVPDAMFNESGVISPGDDVVVAEVDGLRVGWLTCYDLRFPELARIAALRGADVLVVPAAFTAATGPPHWETLLRARAIENQVYVVAAAQAGSSGEGLDWHGHSMIVDPWGVVLVEASGPPVVGEVVMADVDPDRLAQVRSQLPQLDSRQPGAYRWP